jgi:glycogen synthase
LLSVDVDSVTATASRAACRYGTLPIAFASPGALDAVVDIDPSLSTGHGFLFTSLDEPVVFGAIARAITAFNAPTFRKLRHRVMRLQGGFDRAARRLAAQVAQIEG